MHRRYFRQMLSIIVILIFLVLGIFCETGTVDSRVAMEKSEGESSLSKAEAPFQQVVLMPEISGQGRLHGNLTEKTRSGSRRTAGNKLYTALQLALIILPALLSYSAITGFDIQQAVVRRRFIIAYIHHQDGEKGFLLTIFS